MAELISVIMGIYNCESTLPEAIDSILGQTISNWELILCDDGSTDNTYQIASQYTHQYPDRILLLKNEKNLGLNETLNKCLAQAKGDYIARMDGDDISMPERFEKELHFLQNHPEFSIVITEMELFDEAGVWGGTHAKQYPQPEDMVSGPIFCHAPCMVRREAYKAVGGYSTEARFLRVEDRNLWFKMYKAGYRGANLQERLYKMRDNRDAANRRKFKYRVNGARVGLDVAVEFKLGVNYYLKAMNPILIGLLPQPLYRALHRMKLKKQMT